MTLQIWTNWLQNWDLQLCKENQKILLLVGNCSAHADVPLKQIQIMFLSANTTSLIQPCDMGIIRALKAYAHHRIFCRIIKKIDASVEGDTKTVTVYTAQFANSENKPRSIFSSENEGFYILPSNKPKWKNYVQLPYTCFKMTSFYSRLFLFYTVYSTYRIQQTKCFVLISH